MLINKFNLTIYVHKNAVKNVKSVPSNPFSGSPSVAVGSIAKIVNGWDVVIPPCQHLIYLNQLISKII